MFSGWRLRYPAVCRPPPYMLSGGPHKNTRHYKIPVVFHNLKNYNGHLIIQNVGEHTSKISVIPQNYEKYISFSFDHFLKVYK